MFRWIRRIIVWGIVLVIIAIGSVAAAYYAGVTLPIYHDLMPVTFKNWNKTRNVSAEVEHDSSLTRKDGRIHVTVDLQLPEAARRLQSFMDGGRTEIVACGPQKLFMHSLVNSKVDIDGTVIRVSGDANMELAGPVNLRDDWPMATAVRIGHNRTTVWADVLSLEIANIPKPMIAALLKARSHFAYTREQILDIVAASLEPDDAAFLATHRQALDLAFERAVPARRGDVLVLDATISMDEGAVFNAIGDRLLAATSDRAVALAEAIGPAQAFAQFDMKDLGKTLEGAGRELLEKATEGGKPLDEVLENPAALIEQLGKLSDCRVSF